MRFWGVPGLVVLVALVGAGMAVPAGFAAVEGDWRSARLFLYAAVFTLFAAAIVGAAARRGGPPAAPAREELLTLVGAFAVTPVFAAVPVALISPGLGPGGAMFEAVASLTTTGASLLDPAAAPRALHLWRALLGWFGGFLTLVAAAAILAPRELLDLPGAAAVEAGRLAPGRALALGPGGRRAARAAAAIAPVYLGLTLALAVALAASAGAEGEALGAVCHAMGIVATSGISCGPGGFSGQGGGRWAEAVMALGLIAAATRLTYARSAARAGARGYGRRPGGRLDPELRLMAIAVGAGSLWLLARGALGEAGLAPAGLIGGVSVLEALWGTLITALSFLTTTGYLSADWGAALLWSGAWRGIDAGAGLMLIGLATLGGGIATTAGGIKLFRAYALFRHTGAEMGRLPHPSRVDVARTAGGRLTRRAVMNAWVVLMLYLAALATTLLALSAGGLSFAPAIAAATAALSNCGPLLPAATGTTWAELPPAARAVAGAAMVTGRIELLAVVALFNPIYWGR